MNKVYSVASGKISEYELVKETNCFFNIVNDGGHKEKLSKDGFSVPYRRGGRSVVTKDVLKAATSAQEQINIIHKHLESEKAHLCEAEKSLKTFYSEHTIED